jgi:hypothetical protein
MDDVCMYGFEIYLMQELLLCRCIRFDSIRFDSIHTSIRIKTDTHAICTKYRISLLLLYLLCIYSLCIYLLSLSYSLPTLHVIDFLSYHTQTVQLRTCVSILSTHSPTHSLTHSLTQNYKTLAKLLTTVVK